MSPRPKPTLSPPEPSLRCEVLGGLTFALDLAEGQVPGHGLRSCLIAVRLAERLGLPAAEALPRARARGHPGRPAPWRRHGHPVPGGLDGVTAAFADVVDAKSPFTARHPARVADLAEGVAEQLPARILAVADVYEALTASRPYRMVLAPVDALALMRGPAGRGLGREALAALSALAGRTWA